MKKKLLIISLLLLGVIELCYIAPNIFSNFVQHRGKVTPCDEDHRYPVWSPIRNTIAYRYCENGITQIRRYNLDNKTEDILIPFGGYDLMWSPDGEKLSFGSGLDLYIVEVNTGDQLLLTKGYYANFQQAWSPDGNKLAYSNGLNNKEIFIIDADGNNITNITNSNDDDWQPEWSPDGTKIAFVSKRDGDYEIYLMNSNGSNPINLSNHPDMEINPVWSPNGTKIAFVSYREGNYEIYLMDTDGKNLLRLTEMESNDWTPIWSPDGSKIVFLSDSYNSEFTNGHYLQVIDIKTGEITYLHEGSYASWSPDSNQIVFSDIESSGNSHIYIIDANGENLRNLTGEN